jgi:hypothetical protein
VVAGLAYSSQVLNRVPHMVKSSLRQHGPLTFNYHPERASDRFQLIKGPKSNANASTLTLTTSVLPLHYSSPGSMDRSLRSPHLSRSQQDTLRLSLLRTVSALMVDCWCEDHPHCTACDVMLLVGNDLTYAGYASRAYDHLDSLIKAVNERSDPPSLRGLVDRNRFELRVSYSTPSRFFAAKSDQLKEAGVVVEGRGHFIPYSDSLLNDWTGYYGSRPQLKAKIRSLPLFLPSFPFYPPPLSHPLCPS